MQTNPLCLYQYDPLDRLVGCVPAAQDVTRRFYQKNHLTTEIQGVMLRSIMQHNDRLIAQQQRQNGIVETHLLATDQQRSVLNSTHAAHAYTVYGYRPPQYGSFSPIGFNGEQPDLVTGWYFLGNGYRALDPVLMRFISPDSSYFSPFGKGGLNAYAYCGGDPVNRFDPTGHFGNPLRKLLKFFRRPRTTRPANRANETGLAEYLNPLARPDPLPEPSNSSFTNTRRSRSSTASTNSSNSVKPYEVSFQEELPPAYRDIYPDTPIEEPDFEFNFEQTLSLSNTQLNYLENLRQDPTQAPAMAAIEHDINEVTNTIRGLRSLHDRSTLPPYPLPSLHNRAIRRSSSKP